MALVLAIKVWTASQPGLIVDAVTARHIRKSCEGLTRRHD